MTEPRLPDPLRRITNLLPAAASHVGLPEVSDPFGLPDATRYVLLLLDGLGEHVVPDRFLDAMAGSGARSVLTCEVPSTTSVSLTSIGTGLRPGEHGVVGWTYRADSGEVVCPLRWEIDQDPRDAQPEPTIFEICAGWGIPTARVFEPRFEHSELTTLGLRGRGFVPLREQDEPRRKAEAIATAAEDARLVYAYDRSIDHAAHAHGLASVDWDQAVRQMVEVVQRTRALLPADVCLLVTGDHGGLDVPQGTRVVIEDEPQLVAGVQIVAGEARFRHLHTEDPQAVAERWRQWCGDRAWVRTRDEAVAEGWFGPMTPRHLPHLGDVVVAARDSWAFLTTTRRQEWSLVGMHGSLTPAEMEVPLVIVGADH